jgi:hypothetical protein
MNHEEQLHFIWKNRLLQGNSLKTTCGLEVKVILPGEHNSHAGPDFFNARILLGHLVWAGNVEIHHKASLWNHHGHQLDPAYDNVILHVVHHCDKGIKNSKGRLIPSLVVDPETTQNLTQGNLNIGKDWPPCGFISSCEPDKSMKLWLTTLSMKRLMKKTEDASHILTRYPLDRERSLFLGLASGFGLPINSLPFELMASRIPLDQLMDIKESLPRIEALLFGHSGLLHGCKNHDPYSDALMKEYKQLKKTLPGDPVPPHLWKFLRIRPASFPTLRMAQFAAFIHAHFPLDEDLIRIDSIDKIEQMLQLHASEYWNTHYIFGKRSPYSIKKMGQQAIQHLIINVIIPYLHALEGDQQRKDSLSIKKSLLIEMKAESNHIIKKWINFGVKPRNAFESQALLQLYKEYCIPGRCNHCQIGKKSRRQTL